MVERFRGMSISVRVETNKTDYEGEFNSVEDVLYWLVSLELGIYTGPNEIRKNKDSAEDG